jgi:hypothetical protein
MTKNGSRDWNNWLLSIWSQKANLSIAVGHAPNNVRSTSFCLKLEDTDQMEDFINFLSVSRLELSTFGLYPEYIALKFKNVQSYTFDEFQRVKKKNAHLRTILVNFIDAQSTAANNPGRDNESIHAERF